MRVDPGRGRRKYLTLEDVRKQWRGTNQGYDLLRRREEAAKNGSEPALTPIEARQLAQFEEQAVQDYVRIVNRWADHEEKGEA
jgi:hypothetical protein